MKIGFSRVDITPTEPVPLTGYGNDDKRISDNVLSPLTASCVACTDEGGNTVLLIQMDALLVPAWFVSELSGRICKATGLRSECIVIHANHLHTTPNLSAKHHESIVRYDEMVFERITQCAVQALEDRKLVTSAEKAKTQTKGLNFVRHYVLEDGTYKGDNFGELNPSPYQGHTTEADPEMRLVKFHRVGGKDVVLANWQSHPHRTGGSLKKDVSADILGVMRDEMEAKLGCHVVYFNGAGGNINPTSYIPEENVTKSYIEQGVALAQYALGAEGSYEPLALGEVKVSTQSIWEPLNRPDPSVLEACLKIRDFWKETNDSIASKRLANKYGINSQHAAMRFIDRINMKEEGFEFPFTALRIGDMAFMAVPYEMFDTNAKYVRENSPFGITLVASCCNTYLNYVPSAYGYIHGCYETDSTRACPGAGERFAYAMVRMLRSL